MNWTHRVEFRLKNGTTGNRYFSSALGAAVGILSIATAPGVESIAVHPIDTVGESAKWHRDEGYLALEKLSNWIRRNV